MGQFVPEQTNLFSQDISQSKNECDVHDQTSFLGLTTIHRRLFDALQDGWFRPQTEQNGLLFVLGGYVKEHIIESVQHPIEVHIRLDKEKLPLLKAFVRRDNVWKQADLEKIDDSDNFVWWPGPYPISAISSLAVNSEDDQNRLKSLSRQFSNVELPKLQIIVSPVTCVSEIPDQPQESKSLLVLDSELDSIQGAMCMAFWGVPPVLPWLEVLESSLSSDPEIMYKQVDQLDAGWLRFLPWMHSDDVPPPINVQESLWLAAVEVFRTSSAPTRPSQLAEQIIDTALSLSLEYEDELSQWLNVTRGILDAFSTIRFDEWKNRPVSIAIQLVLTRSEPEKLRTWFARKTELPPAIIWSAAILCGLYSGYRNLGNQFRGKNAKLRQFVSALAFRSWTSKKLSNEIQWPSYDRKLQWKYERDLFTLFADDAVIARKPTRGRGKWYMADLNNYEANAAALKLSQQMGWRCISRKVKIVGKNITFESSSDKEKDTYETTLSPGDNIEIKNVLTVKSFRKHVAIAPGIVTDPPLSAGLCLKFSKEHSNSTEVPGLFLVENFITNDEEKNIVKEIDSNWSNENYGLKRRVQHYGWKYDYRSRRVNSDMRIGGLPPWAKTIANRLVEQELVEQNPDQLIVNEYKKNQGIGPHIDSKVFADGIAMVSLLESWEMRFRKKGSKEKPTNIMLRRRSVAVMTGEARYDWTHAIPMRKKEPDPTKPYDRKLTKTRKRRLSLTFRKVLTA